MNVSSEISSRSLLVEPHKLFNCNILLGLMCWVLIKMMQWQKRSTILLPYDSWEWDWKHLQYSSSPPNNLQKVCPGLAPHSNYPLDTMYSYHGWHTSLTVHTFQPDKDRRWRQQFLQGSNVQTDKAQGEPLMNLRWKTVNIKNDQPAICGINIIVSKEHTWLDIRLSYVISRLY